MKRKLFIWVLSSTAAAFSGEHMRVAVCNIGELPGQVIEHAKTEAAYVFRTMGVEVQWTACGAELDAESAGIRPDFVIRARVGGQIKKVGPTSLESMGRAFLNLDGAGYMVDVYYGAIQQFTSLHPIADADQVLGYVIVHELGHLLIGSGHRPNGAMRAIWSESELESLRQRHLKFNDAERAAIMRNLPRRGNGSAGSTERKARE